MSRGFFRSAAEILKLLGRWLGEGRRFFVKWFLPPPFPPDPPDEDGDALDAHRAERDARFGAIEGRGAAGASAAANAEDSSDEHRPVYPTARQGEDASEESDPPRPSDGPMFLDGQSGDAEIEVRPPDGERVSR